MYYSMTFIPYQDVIGNRAYPSNYNVTTDRNTWEHWRLVPTERPAIPPPALKEHYVDIPGANGSLDLTQSLTGYPTYDNRSGSIEFAVINDFRNWQVAYSDIMTTMHGKKMLMVYEEDPQYFYVGRWTIDGWSTGESRSSITFNYNLEPYKWRLYDMRDSWLWDPFNFDTGIIANRLGDLKYTAELNSDEAATILLKTNLYSGDETTDGDWKGYADKQNNVTELIGNAPVPMELYVVPAAGSSITIAFSNPEIYGTNAVTKTFNSTTAWYKDDDLLITNVSGSNDIALVATGHGSISWNFRPGRL